MALHRFIYLTSCVSLGKITTGTHQEAGKAAVKPSVSGIEGLWIRRRWGGAGEPL
jgi:hypothetical protein